MAVIPLSNFDTLQQSHVFSLCFGFALFTVFYSFLSSIYSACFGPLAHFPGPKVRAITIFPYCRTTWTGNDARHILALHEQYGPIVRIGPRHLSFIGTADTWKSIYGFKKHGEPENAKDKAVYSKPVNGVHHLIDADQVEHARMRKLVSHAFSDKALKEQEPLLKSWATKMKVVLEGKTQEASSTDLVRLFNYTTVDIMADLTFAEPLYMLDNGEYTPWVKTIFGGVKQFTFMRTIMALHPALEHTLKKAISSYPGITKKALAHHKYTTDRVDKRLANTPDRPDLWTRIPDKAGDPRSKNGQLSLEQHHSIAALFMLAGTETTATALSGTLYHLLMNPQILKDLRAELQTSFSSVDDLGLESLAEPSLLNAVLKEGLRMYPPVPIGLPRVAPVGGCMIGGEYLPGGTQISIPHFATYHSEQSFKHADQFLPKRWLGDEEFVNDNTAGFEPFHVGPRACLGRNLAWHEMRLLLATALLHFDFKLCAESHNWDDQKVYTLWDKKPLMCTMSMLDKS